MKTTKNNNSAIIVVGVIVAVVLLNLISLRTFSRIDLTRDRKFTLSRASIETVERLEDTMTVSAYFTDGLPPPYAQHSRYVNDLLEEYAAASKGGKLAFQFRDPAAEESAEDKEKRKKVQHDIFGRLIREPTSVETELAELGLQPVEIRVIENDQQQTKRAYMGIVIRYQDKHEVIPVVQDLADLEKNMTSLMRKLVRERLPKIAIVKDAASPSIAKISQAWSQNVSIEEIALTNESPIADDVDALLVLGSADHFGERGAQKIDEFLKKGKSVAIMLDRTNVDPRSFQPQPISPQSSVHKVFDLLKSYGVEVGTKLVADAACASLNMQENRGGFSFSLPVKYPFVPELLNLSFESPITKGLSGVILPFTAPLLLDEKDGFKLQVLARSSKVSWLEGEPFDLNPRRNWGEANIVPDGPHVLMVEARGVVPQSGDVKEAVESRLLVVGSSSFLWDDFLSGPNQMLALNMVDWMLADSALLEMRSRTFNDAPLNADLSEVVKQLVKYGNILGVPFLLVLYGIVRWRLRESRRRGLKYN